MKRFTIGRSLTLMAFLLMSLAISIDSHAGSAPTITRSSDLRLWYVIGDGGGNGQSATYSLSWTTGQNAIGKGNAGTLGLNRGFWQNFSPSCCVGKRGNINMIGIVDVSDLGVLVTYLTAGGQMACHDEAKLAGADIVDLVDLSSLVSYLTGSGFVLPNCPWM